MWASPTGASARERSNTGPGPVSKAPHKRGYHLSQCDDAWIATSSSRQGGDGCWISSYIHEVQHQIYLVSGAPTPASQGFRAGDENQAGGLSQPPVRASGGARRKHPGAASPVRRLDPK